MSGWGGEKLLMGYSGDMDLLRDGLCKERIYDYFQGVALGEREKQWCHSEAENSADDVPTSLF